MSDTPKLLESTPNTDSHDENDHDKLGCCSHDHDHGQDHHHHNDDDDEDDEEMEAVQMQFRAFVMERYPQEELQNDSEEVSQQKLTALMEEFSAILAKEDEDMQELAKQVNIVKERFPQECSEEYKVFFDAQYWIDNLFSTTKEQFDKLNKIYYDPEGNVFDNEDYKLTIPEMTQLSNHILSLPLFPREFLQKLLKFTTYISEWLDANNFILVPPNSMSRYGLTLEYVGLQDTFLKLCHYLLTPIIPMYYPYLIGLSTTENDLDSNVKSKVFDAVHAFTVEYYNNNKAKNDNFQNTKENAIITPTSGKNNIQLATHVDQSHLTISIPLDDGYEGGELYCKGFRCKNHLQFDLADIPQLSELSAEQQEGLSEDLVIKQRMGFGIIHPGHLRHGAKPIAPGGERHNLIIWAANSPLRKQYKGYISPCLLCAFDVVTEPRCCDAGTCGDHHHENIGHCSNVDLSEGVTVENQQDECQNDENNQ